MTNTNTNTNTYLAVYNVVAAAGDTYTYRFKGCGGTRIEVKRGKFTAALSVPFTSKVSFYKACVDYLYPAFDEIEEDDTTFDILRKFKRIVQLGTEIPQACNLLSGQLNYLHITEEKDFRKMAADLWLGEDIEERPICSGTFNEHSFTFEGVRVIWLQPVRR